MGSDGHVIMKVDCIDHVEREQQRGGSVELSQERGFRKVAMTIWEDDEIVRQCAHIDECNSDRNEDGAGFAYSPIDDLSH